MGAEKLVEKCELVLMARGERDSIGRIPVSVGQLAFAPVGMLVSMEKWFQVLVLEPLTGETVKGINTPHSHIDFYSSFDHDPDPNDEPASVSY